MSTSRQPRDGRDSTKQVRWNRIEPKVCSVDGCDTLSYAKGLCRFHYERHKKGRVLIGEKKRPRLKPGLLDTKCSVGDCDSNAHNGSGLCSLHYQRLKTHGVLGGPRKRAPVGTPSSHKGYVMLYDPSHPNAMKNGHVFQHTVIMAKRIGRPLLKHETVHHKNGVRSDNSDGNLELWTKSQPPGQRVEDKIAWAIEFLGEYGYQVSKK